MVKKLLLHTIVFISLLYIARFLLHQGLRENEEGIFKKFNTIFLQSNDFNNLFIGSSRAECHFNPSVFDSICGFDSYNLGVSGSNNAFTYGILKSYLWKSKAPNQVIFNLDFHFSHESSDTIYEFPRFFPYLSNPVLYEELKKRDSRFFLFHYFPFLSLPQMNDKYLNWSLRGFLKMPSTYDKSGLKGNLKIIPLEYKNLDSIKLKSYQAFLLKENLDYLDSIINLTKKMNSRLIIVVSPTYIDGIRRIKNFEEHLSLFSDLAKERGIPFMDYSRDSICYQKEYFADYYHMKEVGCDTFSIKLSNDFKRKFRDFQFK